MNLILQKCYTLCFVLALFYSATVLGDASTVVFNSFKINDVSALKNRYQNQRDSKFKYSIKSERKRNLLEDNNLYRRIYQSIAGHYQSIGDRSSSEILREGFQIGKFNTPGFFWKKSFGEFSIFVRRNIAKGLGGEDRWMITDEFNIIIKAEKVLGELAQNDIIDITSEQMAAFAGLKFKRVYRYTHFANSYEESLVGDYSKLFMSFLFYSGDSIFNMSHNEYIQREDYLSTDIGGILSFPLYTNGALGVYGAAGAIAEFQQVSKSSVHYKNLSERELYIFFEESKSKEIGIALQLKVDFMNLLRITLFSYDFSFQNEENKSVSLKFENSQIDEIQNNDVRFKGLMKALKGAKLSDDLLEFTHLNETTSNTFKKTKYLFLLYQGEKTESTNRRDVFDGKSIRRYYKYSLAKVKNRFGIISRIIPEIIQSLFVINVNGRAKSSDRSAFSIDYKSNRNLINEKEGLILDDNETLNLKIERDLYYKNVSKNKNRSKLLGLMERMTPIPREVLQFISTGEVVGPVKLNIVYQFNQEAVKFFNKHSKDKFNKLVNVLCRNYSSVDSKISKCNSRILKRYKNYLEEIILNNVNSKAQVFCKKKARRRWFFRKRRLKKCLKSKYANNRISDQKIPLYYLKELVSQINRYVTRKEDLISLFGKNNMFIHGGFTGASTNNYPFVHYFKEGEILSGVISSGIGNVSVIFGH